MFAGPVLCTPHWASPHGPWPTAHCALPARVKGIFWTYPTSRPAKGGSGEGGGGGVVGYHTFEWVRAAFHSCAWLVIPNEYFFITDSVVEPRLLHATVVGSTPAQVSFLASICRLTL